MVVGIEFCCFLISSNALISFFFISLPSFHSSGRKVNLACFPVHYQETYYKDVVDGQNEGLCKFAYWNGFVVGAACSRVETIKNNDEEGSSSSTQQQQQQQQQPKKRIYIMTLGVLAAYRGRTIGTQLIQSIFDHYEENKENEYKDVVEILLHVQISNDDAIQFYTSRFGFEKGEMVENYYRRIDPPHCYALYKKLR